MSDIIIKELSECGDKKVKISLEYGSYYGFVNDIDDEYVVIKLDNSDRKVTIRINKIFEVLVLE